MTNAQAEWLLGGKLEDCDLFDYTPRATTYSDLTGLYDFCIEREGRMVVVELGVVVDDPPANVVTPEEIEPFSVRHITILEAGQWSRK